MSVPTSEAAPATPPVPAEPSLPQPSLPEPDGPVGRWIDIPAGPLVPRAHAAAVWTGDCNAEEAAGGCGRVLVWGGLGPDGFLPDGASYDPSADVWEAIAAPPALPADSGEGPRAIWAEGTGTRGELVVWGGARQNGDAFGAAYDPATERWRLLPDAPLAPRAGHSLVWTGQRVVVWGGRALDGGDVLADGASLDLAADRWHALAEAPVPGRWGHGAAVVQDGDSALMVVWGGDEDGIVATEPDRLPVIAYDLDSDRWQVQGRVVAGRESHVIQVAGTRRALVIGSVQVLAGHRRSLPVYAPDGTPFIRTVTPTLPHATAATVVPLRSRAMLVWGPQPPAGEPSGEGWVVDDWDRWVPVPEGPARHGAAVAWTGDHLVVWGGAEAGTLRADGKLFALTDDLAWADHRKQDGERQFEVPARCQCHRAQFALVLPPGWCR